MPLNAVPWMHEYPDQPFHMGARLRIQNRPPFGAGFRPTPVDQFSGRAGPPNHHTTDAGALAADTAVAATGPTGADDWIQEDANVADWTAVAAAAASGWSELAPGADEFVEAGALSAGTDVEVSPTAGDWAEESKSPDASAEVDLEGVGTWVETSIDDEAWGEQY